MRTLLISLALAATLVPAALAQGVTPGGGIGRPLPRCSAIQPACESRCTTLRAQCKQPAGAQPSCESRFTTCMKSCRALQCIR